MSENISCKKCTCNENTCGCPNIVNDNLCCSVKVNNQLCLLPPAKDCIQITFKIKPGAKIIQNAGELCVCGLIEKTVEYTGINPAGCEIRGVKIRQDIPFQCCFTSCDFNEKYPSDYVVGEIEVQNLCTKLSSRARRAGVDVYFCLKETDLVRVRLSKPSPCERVKPCEPCALGGPSAVGQRDTLINDLEDFVF